MAAMRMGGVFYTRRPAARCQNSIFSWRHAAPLRAAEGSPPASKDFNQGLRAYYFSLAALSWFVNPWVFIAATTLVIAVLYWREYHSEALRMLRNR